MSSGLYQLDEFKDNCGFGLIANIKGEKSHQLLLTAIESLTCMTHRGGIAADGKTGDGCGLLLQKPDSFLRAVAKDTLNIELPEHYGIGAIMFSQAEDVRQKEQQAIESVLATHNLTLLGWREVPTNNDCLGPIALDSVPYIAHAFIGLAENTAQKNHQTLNAQLYIARRKIETALREHCDFYICSFSSTVLSYKGLMMPVDLPHFYPDLGDPQMQIAICVFHQRFSTNTLPRWPLAQPFRMLAHNGEINTITGNRNWSVARTALLQSEQLGDLHEIAPIVNRSGSDSSSLDNMLELLTLGGLGLHHAIRMLIPPAWKNMRTIDPSLRAFFEYNSLSMEPWDGPAGLAITDGRYAVCTLDRNGLRPLRWVMTNDDCITLASEIGTYNYKPENVIAKGRLGPGQILSIDTEKGHSATHRRNRHSLTTAPSL